MFDSDCAGLTYAVVADELVRAASAVMEITPLAIVTLPQIISAVGYGRLEVTLRDFCARWDIGLSHLMGYGETMSRRLDPCSQGYVDNEHAARGDDKQLMSCTPPTLPQEAASIITPSIITVGTGQHLGPHRPPRRSWMSAQLESDLTSSAARGAGPGGPARVRLAADTLRGQAGLLDGTVDTQSRIEVTNGRGQASTGFLEVIQVEPGRWRHSGRFHRSIHGSRQLLGKPGTGARADEDLTLNPLDNLLGTYLHDDWPVEHPDVWAAVGAFVTESCSEITDGAHAQVSKLLLEERTETHLLQVLDEYDCSYYPPGDNSTATEFLTRLEVELRPVNFASAERSDAISRHRAQVLRADIAKARAESGLKGLLSNYLHCGWVDDYESSWDAVADSLSPTASTRSASPTTSSSTFSPGPGRRRSRRGGQRRLQARLHHPSPRDSPCDSSWPSSSWSWSSDPRHRPDRSRPATRRGDAQRLPCPHRGPCAFGRRSPGSRSP